MEYIKQKTNNKEKIIEIKILLFEVINKIDEPLARLTKKNRSHKLPISEINRYQQRSHRH